MAQSLSFTGQDFPSMAWDVLQLTIPAFRTTLTTGPSTHTGPSQHHNPALHNHTSPPHSPRTFHQNITKRFTSVNELSPSIPINSRSREAGWGVPDSLWACWGARHGRQTCQLPPSQLNYRPVRYFKGSFQNRRKREKKKKLSIFLEKQVVQQRKH